MDPEIKATIIGLISVALGIVAIISEKYRVLIIVFSVALLVIYFLTTYLNKIDEHDGEIKKIKENINIYERLSKLEAKING